jgi:segregation and condensation protein B
MIDSPSSLRLLEALIFASAEPLDEVCLAERLPESEDVAARLAELAALYENRGVNLVRVGRKWAFRTAPDLAPQLRVEKVVPRRLSRAAIETMAIIAYHQPITRAEIEEVRGVRLSKGTLDLLFETGWVAPRGRRRVPGRPTIWGTTEKFLDHFGLAALGELPGADELKAAGLLDPVAPTIPSLHREESNEAVGADPDDDKSFDPEPVAAPVAANDAAGFETASGEHPDGGIGEPHADAGESGLAALEGRAADD